MRKPSFKKVENLIAQKKVELEDYITNKEIPLKERWDFWGKAPECLKNKERYIISYRKNPTKAQSIINKWTKDSGFDRYQTIKIYDYLDDFYYCLFEELKEDQTREDLINEFTYEFTEEEMIILLEEMLKINLHSFVWDW